MKKNPPREPNHIRHFSDTQWARDVNTTELDPALREIVTYHGRDFQREALVREVHLAPVDDVRATVIEPARTAYSLKGGHRTSWTVWRNNIES
jgi:hypothetical protein